MKARVNCKEGLCPNVPQLLRVGDEIVGLALHYLHRGVIKTTPYDQIAFAARMLKAMEREARAKTAKKKTKKRK